VANYPSYFRFAVFGILAIAIATFVVVAWRRVGEFVVGLQSEDFTRSVEQLLVDREACTYMTGIKFGQDDLPEMLFNRHCVDVVERIAAMREADCEVKCREVFSLLLARHAAAVRRSLGHLEDRNAPRNRQSMRLSEMGVCTAILATALCGGTETLLSQFSELDAFRAEIDRRLTANAQLYPNSLPVAANTRNYYVPDNRFQLNVLCLHAARIGGKAAENALEICSGVKNEEIGNANPKARSSWFEMPGRLAGVPTVRSHGRTNYLLYDWPSEMKYDHKAQVAVIAALRSSIKNL
jgi:hypothetical protein